VPCTTDTSLSINIKKANDVHVHVRVARCFVVRGSIHVESPIG
jgi:hypothetical protein